MTIAKNELPVLEYDSDPVTIVKLKISGVKLPEKAVFAFTGTSTDTYAEANNARIATVFETITRDYNIYIIERNGQEICLMQAPMGAAAAIQSLEMLLALGVKKYLPQVRAASLRIFPRTALSCQPERFVQRAFPISTSRSHASSTLTTSSLKSFAVSLTKEVSTTADAPPGLPTASDVKLRQWWNTDVMRAVRL